MKIENDYMRYIFDNEKRLGFKWCTNQCLHKIDITIYKDV